MNRERVVRTLTFWLRPEFVLRVLNRFQKLARIRPRDRTGLRGPHRDDPVADRRERGGLGPRGKGHGRSHHRPLRANGRRRRGGQGHLRTAHRHEHEPRHRGVPLPAGRGPELQPGCPAAVRANLGTQPAERAQHRQRPTVDRRAVGLPRGQRPHPRRAGAQPPRAVSGAAGRPADGCLPALERPGPQCQADRAPGSPPVRHRRLGGAGGVLRWRERCMCRTSSTHTPPAMA